MLLSPGVKSLQTSRASMADTADDSGEKRAP